LLDAAGKAEWVTPPLPARDLSQMRVAGKIFERFIVLARLPGIALLMERL
jgi:hypothetical protein